MNARESFSEALDDLLSASFDQDWERERKARAEVLRLYDASSQVGGGGETGWVLVPREPTEAMWTAGREPLRFRDAPFPAMMMKQPWWTDSVGKPREDGFLPKGAWAELIWNAMLSAAPKRGGEEG